MTKWLVISPSPQTLLPRWTYCGHFEALGRASQGLVFLGYLPLHFSSVTHHGLTLQPRGQASGWCPVRVQNGASAKAHLFNTLLFGRFGGGHSPLCY